jgi:hypothetical protein
MKVNLMIEIPVWLDKIFAWPALVYRQWKYGYTYRRIYLGQGEWTILDVEDYYRFGNLKWTLGGSRKNFYAITSIKNNKGEIETVRLHRLIMKAPKGRIIDHRNCKGLDNRRENLRIATKAQNACNRRKRSNASSRFLGVSFYKPSNTWAARLQHHGKDIWLGYFKREIDAARAYDKAAKKYHKEFASLNFPEDNRITTQAPRRRMEYQG